MLPTESGVTLEGSQHQSVSYVPTAGEKGKVVAVE